MSSRNKLPQELVDMIVAEHEDNISTLRQCMLVSKSFLDPARRHFFRGINLGVDDDDVRSRHLYRRFRDVTTENPLILTYVRELCVTDNSSSHDPPKKPRW
ncbi:hypothetical protein BDZ94DRAFT_1253951 [Collybia nuda]|uniref:Uncharacterized protein n=1 Tax=Collybia nuda TaxID=64659 RepID=A0A9P5Y8F9_9AGAR|nr:hypothetical protein BDZ94DRAFT_1253951 [Collybia nuda]